MESERSRSGKGAESPVTASLEGSSSGFQKARPLHGRTSGPTRRSTKGNWTAEEDAILCRAVHQFQGRNWKKIAECFKDRTDVQCLHRWQKVLDPELVKGPWSKEEDDIIIELVKKYGAQKWATISKALPGRIGKQCRERWHNHLNPGIKKEAWTQEEELQLIRAHQVYGNKWAELTKFLPGRTDNMIKNHWNSSVKKKLDSYLASGLLERFQGLPNPGNPNQCMPSSSMAQSSSDSSYLKDRAETDEVPECNQASTVFGCSQTDSNITNTIPVHIKDEFKMDENDQMELHNSSPSSSSKQYYTSLDEDACTVTEIPSGISSHELRNNSLHESSDLFRTATHSVTGQDEVHGTGNFMLGSSMGNIMGRADKQEEASVSQSDCCAGVYSEGTNEFYSLINLMKCSNITDIDRCSDSFICQSENQRSETARNLASQPYYPLRSSDRLAPSSSEPLLNSSCPPLSSGEAQFIFGDEPAALRGKASAQDDSELFRSSCDGFIYPEGSLDSSPCHDDNKDLNPVPVDIFGSLNLETVGNLPSIDERMTTSNAEDQDSGALFYEPPRFPSLELPFFSCDLVQSGGDLQQAYSPLGIRQLMMSSMNCSPYSLFDSPSRDDSPDVVLKSAAKSFQGTPSILKSTPSVLRKRHRELLSPLQERKGGKKLERDINQGQFGISRMIAIDSPRLDGFTNPNSAECSLLSPTSSQKEKFTHDKENMDHGFTSFSDDKILEEGLSVDTGQKIQQEVNGVGSLAKIDEHDRNEMAQEASGVLVEQNINDNLFFSPDRLFFSPDRDGPLRTKIDTKNLKYQYSRSLANESTENVQIGQSESSFVNVLSPTNDERKHVRRLVPATSAQCFPLSLPLTFENAGNNGDMGSFGISSGTPTIKRGFESPSAWKSPWFMNSFLPGPRIDTDITIEDIGIFMSPGDRSYDALGLMKQMSEHSAAAVAEAEEFLASDQKGPSKAKLSDQENLSLETSQFADSDMEDQNCPLTAALTERRVLDFSGCDTPGKGGTDSKKSVVGTSVSFSSPSSYLMKGCR